MFARLKALISRIKRSALMHSRYLLSLRFRRTMLRFCGFDFGEFGSYQRSSFIEMYLDAIHHVPYYARDGRYAREISAIGDLDQMLQSLPVLEKSVVKESVAQFHRSPSSRLIMRHTTGGTTGSPLEIIQSARTRSVTTAMVNACYEFFCGLKNPRVLSLTGFIAADSLWHKVPLARSAFLSIYNLKDERKAEIEAHLLDYSPQMIYGYASGLVQLARLFPNGLPYSVSSGKIRCISTSETLTPSDRDLIESNLNAVVHNQYGSQEGQHFVFECEHRGMHVHPARGIVEILKFDSNERADIGEVGRVVVTGLQNRDMPLIRYSLGDSSSLESPDSVCRCGCYWPRLGLVQGRTEDLVSTPDGRRIGLLSHSTLKDVQGIIESQILQVDYSHFRYYLHVDGSYNQLDSEGHIRRELESRLGYSVIVEFFYVDEIEKTAAGKHRAVVVAIAPISESET